MKRKPRGTGNAPTIALWVVFLIGLGGYVYDRYSTDQSSDDCQVYDALGRGIGCEGKDFSDTT